MNQYETVFILTPVLSDVQMKEAVEKFKAILTQEGAEIINEENWGLKKLAYPIQKKSTGPVLSDVQMKEAVEKFKAILTQEGAEIINEENWGLKKLAYPIQKKSTGFYQLIEFKAEPSVIEKLEVNYRRDERVIRFLTFKMDKYAAEYAAKRRNVKSTKKEEN